MDHPSVKTDTSLQPGAVLLLTVGIFILDLYTPIGWADWLLYFIPLVLTLASPRERDPYYFAAVVSCLVLVGGYLHVTGEPEIAFLNRCLGVAVMWGFTWLGVGQKRARAQLLGAETARSKAESHREAALAARELAEATATAAIHRESQTARDLLMSSLRLESILHSAMDAIITIDDQQHVMLFNDAAERMFQCRASDAIGRTLDRFIPERLRGDHRHHVEKFGQSGVTSRRMGQLGTVTGLRADGEEFPAEASISHIKVDGKHYYTVILRDITQRKHAEQLIRQSEERYRRLVAISPYGVLVNRGERVIFANDQAIKMFGAVKAEEILEKSPLELFDPDCRDTIREHMRELLVGKEVAPLIEERIVKRDGTLIDVEVSAAQFADEEGSAILVVLQDISERKRLQEQLRKTERIAELGTLASGMAHEIGTPMNVILGRAEYLMDRVKDEPVRKGLQTIITQVERITKVMNQLLSFARRKAPERVRLDLREVVENNLDIFQERLAKSRILVDTSFEESGPLVLADADQMSQVLINLVMNAIHAMPQGGTMRIGLASEKELVKLTVADTGHGIPQEALGRVFEPFFTTKEFGKGTGLGLTVVKGIIEEHQGTITVESEEGKGTTVAILLPKSG